MTKKITIAYHGHCFDGMCSAAVLTRFLRARDGEAEPRAALALGAGERLEEPRAMRGGHAGAVVGNLDAEDVLCSFKRALHGDPAAAIGRRLHRVGEQVEKHLVHGVRIDRCRRHVRGHLRIERHAAALRGGAHQFARLAHHRAEVRLLDLERTVLGVGQHVHHEP